MRRFIPIVSVVSLLVAACAGGADDDVATSSTTVLPTTSGAPAPDDSAPPPAGPATTAGRAGSDTAAPTTARAERPPATTAPDQADPAPGAGDVQPTPADDGRLGPPGAYARTLLRPRPATRLVVERFHQRDAQPAARTVSLADSTLRRVTGGKDVEVRASTLLEGGGQEWSADQIRALADASGRVAAEGSTAVLRLLFLRGSFRGDDSALGVAVRGDVVAIFSDAIDSARTPVSSSDAIEEAVVIHELGHLLGLVDLARDTGRDDPEHPGHSTNSKSVMYWAVESSLIGQVLTGPPPREFDAADLADLEALRNGA